MTFVIAMICYAKSLQLYPTLCNPIDDSPPGSPVPEILQARILEWVAISFSNAFMIFLTMFFNQTGDILHCFNSVKCLVLGVKYWIWSITFLKIPDSVGKAPGISQVVWKNWDSPQCSVNSSYSPATCAPSTTSKALQRVETTTSQER